MRRLILHIGTEKTGTSSIQRFLSRNRRQLLQQSIGVPLCLADAAGNHSWLPLLAYAATRHDDLTEQWLDPRLDRDDQIAAQRQALRQEVLNSTAESWIVSSEHLQSRLTSGEEILRLRALLEELFEAITLLLYLRQPLATAVSLWSTAVQCGHPFRDLPPPSTPYWHNLCDHRATIERWRAGFPGHHLQVRLFQRGDLLQGDVVADFCAAAGIRPGPQWTHPRQANTTLSHRGIKLCAALNSRLGPPPGGRPSLPLRLIAKLTAGLPRYRPGRREALAYAEAFGPSDDWVREHYFPERPQLWASPPTPHPPPCNPALTRLERWGLNPLARLRRWLASRGQRR
ncbi:MAG: hypothetical protein ACKOZT_00990 [Cyanobium sp.]